MKVKKIDMSKVQLEVLKPWISDKVDAILGFEDEVVKNLVVSLLEAETEAVKAEVSKNLKGFLEANTLAFVDELWDLLVDAEKNAKEITDDEGKITLIGGVPTVILEAKKAEIRKMAEESTGMSRPLDLEQKTNGQDEQQRPPSIGDHRPEAGEGGGKPDGHPAEDVEAEIPGRSADLHDSGDSRERSPNRERNQKLGDADGEGGGSWNRNPSEDQRRPFNGSPRRRKGNPGPGGSRLNRSPVRRPLHSPPRRSIGRGYSRSPSQSRSPSSRNPSSPSPSRSRSSRDFSNSRSPSRSRSPRRRRPNYRSRSRSINRRVPRNSGYRSPSRFRRSRSRSAMRRPFFARRRSRSPQNRFAKRGRSPRNRLAKRGRSRSWSGERFVGGRSHPRQAFRGGRRPRSPRRLRDTADHFSGQDGPEFRQRKSSPGRLRGRGESRRQSDDVSRRNSVKEPQVHDLREVISKKRSLEKPEALHGDGEQMQTRNRGNGLKTKRGKGPQQVEQNNDGTEKLSSREPARKGENAGTTRSKEEVRETTEQPKMESRRDLVTAKKLSAAGTREQLLDQLERVHRAKELKSKVLESMNAKSLADMN